MQQSLPSLLAALVLGCCLVVLAVPDAEAQTRQERQAPAQRQVAPSQGAQSAPARPGRSGPAGTRLPSYAQPSSPPSVGQPPSGGATPPGGQAQTNTPGTPTEPNQVPLGGAEYLAAAGAAYALNRLRKENGDDEEDEESDDMP